MMFLQYAIWGAWLPILYPFLIGHRGFTLDQCGSILAAGAFGAVAGPFIAGQIADRFFSTEKYLAYSHLAGAALVWWLSTIDDYSTFLWVSLAYGFVYAPTLALTNSLAFHHLTDRDRDFGWIRCFGTIGWIAASIAVGQWLLLEHTPFAVDAVVKAAQDAGRADAFRLSAILGVVMGLYCWTLPHTPPDRTAKEAFAFVKALRAVVRQPLATLFLLAIPVSCIHQFYFVFTSEFLSKFGRDEAQSINRIFGVGGGGLMAIGQVSEVLVLAVVPIFAKRVSRKALLTVGILAYATRMALFAYTSSLVPILTGVALHGLCFGCFIFVSFMIVDEETTSDVRASAQNLYNLVFIGVGIMAGSWVSLSVVGAWAKEDTGEMNYTKLFSAPLWASLACLAILTFLYPGGRRGAAVKNLTAASPA
jgi:nucleoside transporter